MTKPKNYEDALAQLDTAKENLANERVALREFKAENKIRRNKPVEDAEVAKKLEAAEGKVEAARTVMDEVKSAAKELKPRKERVTKYNYPEDCITDKDKKRHRAKMRRELQKEEKGDAKEVKPAAKKAVKKPAAKTEED